MWRNRNWNQVPLKMVIIILCPLTTIICNEALNARTEYVYLAITFFTRIKMWVEGNRWIRLGLLKHLMEASAVRAPFSIFMEILISNAEKILQLSKTIMSTKPWSRGCVCSFMINWLGCSILQQCQINCQLPNALYQDMYTEYDTCLRRIQPSWNDRASRSS